MAPTEEARERYRPQIVRVLFVGESRPAGGTFFYFGNSILFRATRAAFARAVPDLVGRDFLNSFQALGCYLEDLCGVPVNRLPDRERREQRRMGEDALAQRVEGLAPQRVVIVMAGIAENVRRALLTAQIDAPVSVLPFPRREHERRYVTELAQILLELRQSDAFLSPPKRLKRRWFGRN